MSPGNALEHETRKAIFRYVSSYPGAPLSTIRDGLGLPESTVRYHLQYLERHEVLYSRESGNFRSYFPAQKGSADLMAFPQVDPNALTDLQRQITELIRDRPGIGMAELESVTGVNRRVLQYNVKVLRENMLVWKSGNGKSTAYEIASRERLGQEMVNFLTMKLLRGEIDESTFLRLKGEVEREWLEE